MTLSDAAIAHPRATLVRDNGHGLLRVRETRWGAVIWEIKPHGEDVWSGYDLHGIDLRANDWRVDVERAGAE